MTSAHLYTFTRSQELMSRALKVIPSGIYGHKSPAFLTPGSYPTFLARGEGPRIWDVDGNEYLDFMCSYGPIILGHGHPKVEEAAAAQRAKADGLNMPSEKWVELAELLVSITPAADWVVFAKNGSDVTTWALTVARAYTGRDKVIMASGAYHGADAWCTPIPTGIPAVERALVATFEYNDLEDLKRVVNENKGQVAGIIVNAFRHDFYRDEELPTPEFVKGVRALCDQEGIILVLDDVRAGFRLDMGGSWEPYGVRPDLMCYSKAIANGYALAVGLGREELRATAQSVYFTGTFWTAAVSMAAAVATINTLREEGGIEQLRVMGQRWRQPDGPAGHPLPHLRRRLRLPAQPSVLRRGCPPGCVPSPPPQLVHDDRTHGAGHRPGAGRHGGGVQGGQGAVRRVESNRGSAFPP
jgi:glutamate-1-semialdehyde 2,1-aminomutase